MAVNFQNGDSITIAGGTSESTAGHVMNGEVNHHGPNTDGAFNARSSSPKEDQEVSGSLPEVSCSPVTPQGVDKVRKLPMY